MLKAMFDETLTSGSLQPIFMQANILYLYYWKRKRIHMSVRLIGLLVSYAAIIKY